MFYARRAAQLADLEQTFLPDGGRYRGAQPQHSVLARLFVPAAMQTSTSETIQTNRNTVAGQHDPNGNPWGLQFLTGCFDMANDSGMFRTVRRAGVGRRAVDGNLVR